MLSSDLANLNDADAGLFGYDAQANDFSMFGLGDDLLSNDPAMAAILAGAGLAYSHFGSDLVKGKSNLTKNAYSVGNAAISGATSYYAFRIALDDAQSTALRVVGAVLGTLSSAVAVGSLLGVSMKLLGQHGMVRSLEKEATYKRGTQNVLKAATTVVARAATAAAKS